MCIEINAHALIALICLIQKDDRMNDDNFLPWLLGSQSCESLFRSLRSMTSTYSTMVNFSLYGLLQRLHKLHIQEECHSKTGEASGIHFPRQERYGKRKNGTKQYENFSVTAITPDKIYDILKKAERRAQESMKRLGMADTLKKDDKWISPPVATHLVIEENDSEDDDDNDGDGKNESIDHFVSSSEEMSEVIQDIDKLHSSDAVHEDVKNEIKKIQMKMPFVKSKEESDISVYKKGNDQMNTDEPLSEFLKLDLDGRKGVYIRKRTAYAVFLSGFYARGQTNVRRIKEGT